MVRPRSPSSSMCGMLAVCTCYMMYSQWGFGNSELCLALKSSSVQLDAVWLICQPPHWHLGFDVLSLPTYHFQCSEDLFLSLVLIPTQFEAVYSVEAELFNFCYSRGGHFPVLGNAASLYTSAARDGHSQPLLDPAQHLYLLVIFKLD